jgi:cytidyltransferase-like protein
VTTVFVSGCYDLIHGGHIEFLRAARAIGDRLIVCLPSDRAVAQHRNRVPSLPCDQKLAIFSALRFVDEVVVGDDDELGLNFKSHFLGVRPTILAAGADDQYEDAKRELCREVGAEYVQLPRSRTWPDFSATRLVQRIRAPLSVPLRVDFAGGWLDVPALARPGAFVVNCTINAFATLDGRGFRPFGGLGGSAARSILQGYDGVETELGLGVGWQDPAAIVETGLCVWRSGAVPVLDMKRNPVDLLGGRMALWWTGQRHDTPGLVRVSRDYQGIDDAASLACESVLKADFGLLCQAVDLSYSVQLKEGMPPLPAGGERAKKYCGGGWGGYAVYLFEGCADRERFVESHPDASAIEPFMRFQ